MNWYKPTYFVSRAQNACLCVNCVQLIAENEISVGWYKNHGKACIKCVTSKKEWNADIQKPKQKIVEELVQVLLGTESHRAAQEDQEDVFI